MRPAGALLGQLQAAPPAPAPAPAAQGKQVSKELALSPTLAGTLTFRPRDTAHLRRTADPSTPGPLRAYSVQRDLTLHETQ